MKKHLLVVCLLAMMLVPTGILSAEELESTIYVFNYKHKIRMAY